MGDLCGCCRRIPVTKTDFGLNWNEPDVFARSQWPIPKWGFLVYRMCFMVYLIVWDTLYTCDSVDVIGAYHLIFLTSLSFHVLTLYGFVAGLSVFYYSFRKPLQRQPQRVEESFTNNNYVISNDDGIKESSAQDISSNYHVGEDNDGTNDLSLSRAELTNQLPTVMTSPPSNPWYFRLSWILFNINVIMAPVITVVYWSLLYEPTPSDVTEPKDPIGKGSNINVHAMNSVAIYLDLFVTAYPVRIAHVVYGLAYGLSYVIFSVIYWAAGGINPFTGGKAIYPILDWEEIPGLTMAFILAIAVALILIQCIAYALYRLRVFVYQRCCRRRSNENRTNDLPM